MASTTSHRVQSLSPIAAMILVVCSVAGCIQTHRDATFTQLTDPSGRQIEQITSEPFDEYQNRGVTHDGEWISIAYNEGDSDAEGPTTGAYFLNLRTGERTDLQEPLNNCGSFSPDGKRFVGAHADPSGRTEIFELDRQTGEATLLASHERWEWLPSYSPDGEFVVFNSDRVGNQMDLFLLNRATLDLRRLTTDPRYDAHAQFSPDGSRILFHRRLGRLQQGGYVFDLYVIDLESGVETRLTDGAYEESYASFAPDGEHIVFSADFDEPPEQSNLYILGPDGEIHGQLTDGNWKDSYAYWTPDGQYIYFNSTRDGASNVCRIPMRGEICAQCESDKSGSNS